MSLKLALIGYGKMGQKIDAFANEAGCEIVARIDPHHPSATAKILTPASVNNADVCIEFTRPEETVKNIRLLAEAQKPMVIGTTGWYAQLPEIKTLIQQTKGKLVYSPNFALGVQLFIAIARRTAQIMAPVSDEYDIALSEEHHKQKIDAPSGTAKALASAVLEALPHKKDLPITASRYGFEPGTHHLIFDSPADSITLTHRSRNRDGFAKGALRAARWILQKQGLFDVEEMIQDILSGVSLI